MVTSRVVCVYVCVCVCCNTTVRGCASKLQEGVRVLQSTSGQDA